MELVGICLVFVLAIQWRLVSSHDELSYKHRELQTRSQDELSYVHRRVQMGGHANHSHHMPKDDRVWSILQQRMHQKHLISIAERHREDYANAYPFPHAVIDGLFPEEVFDALDTEILDNPKRDEKGCVEGNWACFMAAKERPELNIPELNKNGFEGNFKPSTNAVFSILKSSPFVRFLEKLSGIQGLIPDPHFIGSGVHQTLRDGFLGIHADFNHLWEYGLHRRVNVFLYLNDHWNDSYGGHLELWSKDMKRCGAKIRPDRNRFAVFSSTDFSYHGHPTPLTCPEDRSRRSIALYYYTTSRPNSECINGNCFADHTTLFQTSKCGICSDLKCQKKGFKQQRNETMYQ